jgi:hypothetical protein
MLSAVGRRKKRGNFLDQNSRKSLKKHAEKMSTFRLSTMLMKTNELQAALHDVVDKKGG